MSLLMVVEAGEVQVVCLLPGYQWVAGGARGAEVNNDAA